MAHLSMYVIYYGATDRPADKYTAREHRVTAGSVVPSLDARDFGHLAGARDYCRAQLAQRVPVRLDRDPQDDAAIVELWV